MTLTPREIQEKQFHDAFRGYSHEEVDLFIDQVAEAYDQVYRENQALHRRIEELEQGDGRPAPEFIPAPVSVQASTTPPPLPVPTAATAESEDMLKRVLMTAQESADKAVQNARARAQALIEEAEAKARMIEEQTQAMRSSTLEDAQRRASETLAMAAREEAELKERIEGLRTFERDFRNRLGAFVKAQLEVLESKPLIASSVPSLTPSFSERSKSRTFDTPAPLATKSEPAWLSLSDKPATIERPARREASPEGSARETGVRESSARDSNSARSKAAEGPERQVGETAKGKSKVENRSIRELFWGDD